MKEGWKLVKLEDVCKFSSGFAFKSNKFAEEGEPIIRISDIQNDKVDDTGVVFFDPKDYDQDLSKFIIYPNDILIAMSGGTTGKIGINKTGRKFYLNQRVGVFREDKAVLDHTFLFHYLHTKSEEGLRIAAGAAQPNLSSAQIKNYIIPLPPLPEQQRIVEYLDTTFAEIDALKAKAAEEVANAKAMFDAALREEMTPKEGWKEEKLEKICTFSSGFAFKSNKFTQKGEPIIRISDIQDGEVQDSATVYFNPKDYEQNLSKYRIFPGEILIAMSGGTTGKVGINRTNKIFYLNQRVGVFRENPVVLNKIYLYYYLITKSDEGLRIAAGAAQPNLSTSQINNYLVPLPKLGTQLSIVARLDSLRSLVTELEQKYTKIATECDALKQAILKETFE